MQICAVLAGKGPAGAEGVAKKSGCGSQPGSCRQLQRASGRTCCTLHGIPASPRLLVPIWGSHESHPINKLVPPLAIYPEVAPAWENWKRGEKDWEQPNLLLMD